MKFCPRCKATKPQKEFYKNRTKADGRQNICIECELAGKQRMRKEDPERFKLYDRRKRLKDRYSMSIEEHRAIIATGCHVCGSHEGLCIDHCHVSGKVRGVLCRLCNLALGYVQDNTDTLRELIGYLERSEGV